jgi:hypothetical protein
LQVSDIEAACGLATGSLFIEGDTEFTTIQDQNLWTEYQDLPYFLRRFVPSEFNPRASKAPVSSPIWESPCSRLRPRHGSSASL